MNTTRTQLLGLRMSHYKQELLHWCDERGLDVPSYETTVLDDDMCICTVFADKRYMVSTGVSEDDAQELAARGLYEQLTAVAPVLPLVLDMETYPDYQPATGRRVVGVYHPLQAPTQQGKSWTTVASVEISHTLAAVAAAMGVKEVSVLTTPAREGLVIQALRPIGIKVLSDR